MSDRGNIMSSILGQLFEKKIAKKKNNETKPATRRLTDTESKQPAVYIRAHFTLHML